MAFHRGEQMVRLKRTFGLGGGRKSAAPSAAAAEVEKTRNVPQDVV